MPLPKDIDPEALELLIEDDWPWDDWLFGFRRARRVTGIATNRPRGGIQTIPLATA